MSPRILLVFLVCLALPHVAFSQTTWYVPDDYPKIQDAIADVSVIDGDTLVVRPGTYVENLDFLGKAITVRSELGPDVTHIDGGSPANPDHGSVVAFRSGEGSASVIEGFTLRGGSGTKKYPNHYYGGNIFCDNSGPIIKNNVIMKNSKIHGAYGGGICCCEHASPIITGNTIMKNVSYNGSGIYCLSFASPTIKDNLFKMNGSSQAYGGGIYLNYHCDPIIQQNVFMENHARSGGAIWVENQSHPSIEGNLFTGNSAEFGGGAISCAYDSSAEIMNNRIVENYTTHGGGGGISCEGAASVVIQNNVIARNLTNSYGGGIFCHGTAIKIVNNTLVGNEARSSYRGGGGLYCMYGAVVDIFNTILWDNKAPIGPEIGIGVTQKPAIVSISYSNVKGGTSSVNVEPGCVLHWNSGMINSAPLFVDASIGDFHLTYHSLCRGAGDNAAPGLADHDFEGDPRIYEGTVDMGADEFHRHLYYTGNPSPGEWIDLKFVDLPKTFPVSLFYSTAGVLDPPIPTVYGDWYLASPVGGPMPFLGWIPSNGVKIAPVRIPSNFPAPFDVYMQAIMGSPPQLTNFSALHVK